MVLWGGMVHKYTMLKEFSIKIHIMVLPVVVLKRPAFSRNEARAGPKDFVMSSIPIDHGVRVFICTYAKRPVLKVKIKLRKNGRCQRSKISRSENGHISRKAHSIRAL